MGGSNEKSNLVLLTARQHYIAHWMLWKAYKGKMTRAFVLMSGRVGAHKYNSKYYAKAKEELSEMMKGDGNPSSKGLTDEHKQNISKAVTGRIYSEEKKRNFKEAQNKPEQRKVLSDKRKEYLSDPENYAKHIENAIRICKDPEVRLKKSITMSKKRWYNNGKQNIRVEINDIPEGFVAGRIKLYQ